MKTFFKYFTYLFITVIITIGLSVVFLFHYNNEDIVTEEQVRETVSANQILSNPKSGFSQLTPEEQAAYLRICNEIEDVNDEFYLTGNNVTEDQFSRITNFILKDHPEYFYVDSLEYLKTDEGVVESVSMNYTGDEETIAQQKLEVENWKDAVLAQITPGMDNYQVAKFLHDYLIDNVSYDETVENNQNILSVIEQNKSVCAGYSKAYQYLLNQAGIFSTYISGTVDNYPHAWNLVQIDGQYGWIDLTWDDPSFKDNASPEGYRSHSYFGISSDALEKTHILDKSFEDYESLAKPSFNYFTREGLYYDLSQSGSYEALRSRLIAAQNAGDPSLEVQLANSQQVSDLIQQLIRDPLFRGQTLNYIQDGNYPIISFLLR